MLCYAYIKNNMKESFFKHLYCMLEVWDKIRNYYSMNIHRTLNYEDSDTIMKILILAHDSGKLLEAYQEGEKKYYRHEVISAYVAYKITPNILSNVNNVNEINLLLSNTVLLHHENIILGVYAGTLGERFITISTLKRMLDYYNNKLKIKCDIKNDPFYDKVNQRIEFLDKFVDETINLFNKVNIEDIYHTISGIIISSTSKFGEDTLIIRNKVASLLHLLNVVDSVAATISRSKLDPNDIKKDFGNWIAEKAFSGAELIDKNLIKCGDN